MYVDQIRLLYKILSTDYNGKLKSSKCADSAVACVCVCARAFTPVHGFGNHSYFPPVLSCFTHDGFTREKQTLLPLYYLVKNARCISQALSLPFYCCKTTVPVMAVSSERSPCATSFIRRWFISRHRRL